MAYKYRSCSNKGVLSKEAKAGDARTRITLMTSVKIIFMTNAEVNTLG